MSKRWVILERDVTNYHEDGIRFIARPMIDDYDPEFQIEVSLDFYGQRHWIVEEVKEQKQKEVL